LSENGSVVIAGPLSCKESGGSIAFSLSVVVFGTFITVLWANGRFSVRSLLLFASSTDIITIVLRSLGRIGGGLSSLLKRSLSRTII